MRSCLVDPRYLVVSVLLVFLLGCREETESPTAPDSEPTLAVTSHALLFRQVTAGLAHTCGVAMNHEAWCWGGNFLGQLGEGTTTEAQRPVRVAGGLRFSQVSAGTAFTCGITLDSRLYCWGDNFFGQLGDSSGASFQAMPVAVAGGLQFAQVSAGAFHTCGVTTENQAYCWGLNADGNLGHEVTFGPPTPFPVVGGLSFHQVSAAQNTSAYPNFSCGVTLDQLAYCWGNDEFGQLGSGGFGQSFGPIPVAGGLQFRQISAGALRTCGVTTDDLAYCWGPNNGGVGDGTTMLRRTPVPVAGGIRFQSLSDGGEHHMCGVALSQQAYCWGQNFFGQIGDGTNTARLTPALVAGGLRFRQVVTGSDHSCGITQNHRVYCWGQNRDGQVGDGTHTDRLSPVLVTVQK